VEGSLLRGGAFVDIRKFLKINLINLIILGAIVLFRVLAGMLFNDHDEDSGMYMAVNITTIVMGLVWAIYAIYSNITILKEDKIERKRSIEELKTRLMKAGNKKFYKNERRLLLNMIESIESRRSYFELHDKDSKLRELFDLTENQMVRNITNATEYIETFDYFSGKDSGYVKSMCDDSQHLLDKFNKLVELSVTYDDTATDFDTREIDDMINALETMRETGKARLGS
jgi:hypothetical protein